MGINYSILHRFFRSSSIILKTASLPVMPAFAIMRVNCNMLIPHQHLLRNGYMSFDYSLKKLTDCKWLNLFEISFKKNGQSGKWLMCSRKDKPIENASCADAVVIVAIIKTATGNKIVLNREFRIPLGAYQYGFPAGLIDDGETVAQTAQRELKEETGLNINKILHTSMPVFSSAGMSDESNYMVLVEANGEITDEFLEESEDIEVELMDINQVKDLLQSKEKVAAKAWGMLYHFTAQGSIEF